MRRKIHHNTLFILIGFLTFNIINAQPVQTSRQVKKPLAVPVKNDGFNFVILGDRTTGSKEGLDVLQRAVDEINVLCPDFVINVGDMIQGYNGRKAWIQQAREFKKIMNLLNPPFFPVAGNHDVYWRGEGRPPTEHEAEYEKVFGPLWYAFKHKGSLFVVLFSDEGHPGTGEKSTDKAECQMMSDAQKEWLRNTLAEATDANHVFLFLHHPRWKEGQYGQDWQNVHQILKEAGNVSAVFAGHVHMIRYYGEKDGIDYYTLGTTGGTIPEEELKRQARDHYFIVNVQPDSYDAVMVPVGSFHDPRSLTEMILVSKQKVAITSNAKRKQEFQVNVDNYGAKGCRLRIGAGHGADDSGDKGFWVYLQDDQREILKRAFMRSEGVEWVNCNVQQGKTYIVVVEDNDTQFTGRYPGNIGSIEILLQIKD